VALLFAEFSLFMGQGSLIVMAVSLWLFFTAFNLLEASLPSLVSKMAPPDRKGTAMGIYSSSQFLGIFLGGVLGGFVYEHWHADGVFLSGVLILAVWLTYASSMEKPQYLASYVLNVGAVEPGQADHLAQRITEVRGVAEVVLIPEEQTAYLKVDARILDEDLLNEFSMNRA
jgi:MFS family permease